jgi:cell division transport system permease protein
MSEILTNIRRTPYQSFTIVLVQVFAAFLTLITIFGALFLFASLRTVESQLQLVVYFKPKTSEESVLEIRDFLRKSGQVTSVTYIDKQRAFDIYRAQTADNPLLLEMTTVDIFPASLEIRTKEPEYLNDVAAYLEGLKDPESAEGVDEVQYEKKTINRLLRITNIIRIVTSMFVGYLSVMTIIILATITTYKIALRRDEIEIMQLLGATPSDVVRPLFLEGNLLATVASFTAFAVFSGILLYVSDTVGGYFSGVETLKVVLWEQGQRVYDLQIFPLSFVTISALSAFVWLHAVVISALATRISANKYLQ